MSNLPPAKLIYIIYKIITKLHCICIYTGMYCRLRSNYQKGRVGIPFTCLTLLHLFACIKPGPGLPTSYVEVPFFFISLSWVEVRGDCSFYWYWWNCWTSLYKLSFQNSFNKLTSYKRPRLCVKFIICCQWGKLTLMFKTGTFFCVLQYHKKKLLINIW